MDLPRGSGTPSASLGDPVASQDRQASVALTRGHGGKATFEADLQAQEIRSDDDKGRKRKKKVAHVQSIHDC